MNLTVKRQPAVEHAIPGELYIDGRFAYFTLERVQVAIPAGRYPVVLTVSQRAMDGQLWTPDPDHRLPLIDNVPNRSGIRIHALNEAYQSDGCIGVGMHQMGITIRQSRAALTTLVSILAIAREPVWLTVEAPAAERALSA